MEALIDRQTGDVLVVAEAGVIAWSPRERDGETLCVITLDDATLWPEVAARGKRFYPYALCEIDAAGFRHRRSISTLQVPASKRRAGATVVREGLTVVMPAPLDMQMLAEATGTEVSDVGTGRTYATLAGWWAARKSLATFAPQARVWGPDDVGPVVLTGATATPTAGYPHRIAAAPGQRHDGTRASTNDAHINVPAGHSGIESHSPYTHIEGVHLSLDATAPMTVGLAILGPSGHAIVEGNLVSLAAHSQVGIGINVQSPPTGVGAATVRGNIIYGLDGEVGFAGIGLRSIGGGLTGMLAATLENNSVFHASAASGWYGVFYFAQAVASAATLTVASVNNVVTSSTGNDFGQTQVGSGTAITVAQDSCVSTDGSAQEWGGRGNRIDQVASELFDDPADATTPSEFGPLDLAGENRYAEGVTSDVLGNSRPAMGPFTVGAVSLYREGTSIYNVYRGDSVDGIDYGVFAGRCRGAGPLLSVAEVSLPASQTSYLAVRCMSLAGVEETNTDRIAAVTLDAARQVVAGMPGVVRALGVHELSDGSFVIGFSQSLAVSPAMPERFEVFSDGGTGTLQTGQPVATVTARGGREDYTVWLKPGQRPGLYGVQAISGDQRSAMVTTGVPAGMASPQPPTLL